MMNLIKKYKEVILYLFFGVVTTVVNILVFQLCRAEGINLLISNFAAWLISVLVAFVTNKLFVFGSTAFGVKKLMKECVLFFGARVLSLGIDMAVIFMLVDVLCVNEFISKILSNVIVIVVNYLLSKLVIFKK